MDENTKHASGRVWLALALVTVGGALFAEQMGAPLPYWLFNWKMLLIVIGVFVGFNSGFRGPGWAIMILIGGIFLLDDLLPGFSFERFAWPLVIIVVGVLMLVRPRRRNNWNFSAWEEKWKHRQNWHQRFEQPAQEGQPKASYSPEDFFESTSVFGGVKKVILSKNFQGGDITCFMGGCEIDLTKADFQTKAVIDITQVFGGTKIIIPSHWQISSEMTAIFGAIEDKRQQPLSAAVDKILVIQGTSIFGGIEIKNY